jgi:hypothetical protein
MTVRGKHPAMGMKSAPASAPPAEVSAMSSPDKARADELTSKVSAYQAKPAPDNQTRLDIAHIVSVSNDEIRAVSGAGRADITGGGLQQPKRP